MNPPRRKRRLRSSSSSVSDAGSTSDVSGNSNSLPLEGVMDFQQRRSSNILAPNKYLPLFLAFIGSLCLFSNSNILHFGAHPSNLRRSLSALSSVDDIENFHQQPNPQEEEERNVLILGDSVARMVVQAACREDNDSWTDTPNSDGTDAFYNWDRDLVFNDYHNPQATTGTCRTDVRKKVGFLHTFGSLKEGPYIAFATNCTDLPYCKTPERMCKAIEQYTKHEGAPTHIVLAIMMWDTQTGPCELPYEEEAIAEWKERIKDRLQDVRNCLPPGSHPSISISTTPSGPNFKYKLLYRLNRELRALQKELNPIDGTCLIDYDWAVHHGPGFDPPDHSLAEDVERGSLWPSEHGIETIQPLFQDTVHPNYANSYHHAMYLLNEPHDEKTGCLRQLTAPYSRGPLPEESEVEWFREHAKKMKERKWEEMREVARALVNNNRHYGANANVEDDLLHGRILYSDMSETVPTHRDLVASELKARLPQGSEFDPYALEFGGMVALLKDLEKNPEAFQPKSVWEVH